MRFPVIYADPPWAYNAWSDKGTGRAACRHYALQGTTWLESLPVSAVADKDCTLLMWATFPRLPDALKVIEAWGFEFKTVAFTWVKLTKCDTPSMGLGYWTRSNAEICLLATKGAPKRISKDVRQIIECPIGRHSEKPLECYDRIERLCQGPYLEMFHRPLGGLHEERPNWAFLGNEVTGNDMRIDLEIIAEFPDDYLAHLNKIPYLIRLRDDLELETA